MKKMKLYICTLITMFVMAMQTVAFAAHPIWVEMNQSHTYRTGSSPVSRVSVANPAVADVIVIDNTELNIIGKSVGSTSMSVWTQNGMRQDFVVSVSSMDTTTAQFIKQSMGLDNIDVRKVGDKLILQGMVENQNDMKKALGVAQVFAKDEKDIINLIEMKNPTMVNLAALVIDISDADAKNIGIQYSGDSSTDSDSGNSSTITFGTSGTFYGGESVKKLIGHPFSRIDFMINALAKKNKVRVLSRPNITTMSGEEAEILIGGEMGVPTTKDGEVTVTWKDYGIHLKIKPTVDRENKILTNVYAEVSDINLESGLRTNAGMVYGLTSRKASTVVSLPDGETMAIGGLMNNNDSKVITKIPILGDIPIIGNFFKHTSKSKDKRELMILIKPTIVTTNDPVKGSTKMLEAVEEQKRTYAEMEDIYPNEPPKPVVSNKPNKKENR